QREAGRPHNAPQRHANVGEDRFHAGVIDRQLARRKRGGGLAQTPPRFTKSPVRRFRVRMNEAVSTNGAGGIDATQLILFWCRSGEGPTTCFRATLFFVADNQNITLSLPRQLLKRVKRVAADRDTSVSALMAEALGRLA